MRSNFVAPELPAIEDVKPQYHRKPRKDGTARKTRVFGKPWWYEKAGWAEERWNERRTALLDRLREGWPDWSSFEQDAPTEDDIKQWIRPVVATFDDMSWCLPETSDTLTRLEEQLTIYSAWAKFIIREASLQMSRNLPDQDTASEGPQLANKSAEYSERNPRLSVGSAKLNGANIREVYGTLPHQWRQRRSLHSRTSPTATKRKVSNVDGSKGEMVRTPSHRSSHNAARQPSIASSKARRPVVAYTSDEGTEINEVSDSEPLRHAEASFETPADESMDGDNDNVYHRKWRDLDWDDVVVTLDATLLNGEYFPIPMTMLKPGSSRASCRWDDFELDDLYARFRVESGFDFDRNKYVIIWSIKETSMTINTPGKYKLMLKEFAEKTRRSSAMVLCLRIIEHTSLDQTPVRNVRQQSLMHKWHTPGEKRSQFTGAASDFSSDSESASAQPPLKRQRPANEHEPTSAYSESTAAHQHHSPERSGTAQAAEMPLPQARSDLLKVRESPQEFTQDSD